MYIIAERRLLQVSRLTLIDDKQVGQMDETNDEVNGRMST